MPSALDVDPSVHGGGTVPALTLGAWREIGGTVPASADPGTCGTNRAPKLGDRKEMGGMVEPRLGGRKIPPLVCPGTGCPAVKAGSVALAATEAEGPPPALTSQARHSQAGS